MAELTLEIVRKIRDVALAKGVEKKLKPLIVTVLDARGCVTNSAQDGTSLRRSEIAHRKTYGAGPRSSTTPWTQILILAIGRFALPKTIPLIET
jgi:uncharacterized protein GlcG (DUF336 family)